MHVLFEEIIKKIAIFRARLILRLIVREDFPEQTPRQCGPGPLVSFHPERPAFRMKHLAVSTQPSANCMILMSHSES
jgi:hypothetical protein